MQPNNVGALAWASAPALSPDGKTVAFTVTTVDLAANRYRSRIWLAPTDGHRPAEPLTSGDRRDAGACWSPDGRRLAFTSITETAPSEPPRTALCIVPVDGPGERVTIASGREAFADLQWSPDGRAIAFAQRVRGAHYESDDVRDRPPRRVTRFMSQLNDEGWTFDRPMHIHVVAADGSGAPRDLTPGEFEFDQPRWFASSAALAAVGRAHDTWDTDLAADVYTIDLDGNRTRLTSSDGIYILPSPSPDGTRVAVLGSDDPLVEPQNARVAIVDVASNERHWIDTGIDRTWAPSPGAFAPRWLDDAVVLASCEDRGNTHLYRVDATTGAAQPLIAGERKVLDVDARAGVIAAAVAYFDRPGEIHTIVDGVEHVVSRATDNFTATVKPRAAERFTAGAHDIDVWVLTPDDFDASARGRYPMLVNIHGGPFTQYGNTFFDEAHVQAAAGYVVVMSNPRGGSGRETDWGQAIRGTKAAVAPGTGWGGADADDIHTVVDAVLERYPAVDATRVGVLGGSYGGYLTSWLVGHTDRFAAACSERAVNNMLTMEWTSDIATMFRTEIGASHLDDPAEYLRMSPITYVRNIATPLLIIHSEDDLRCPISQAEELFVAMRVLGKEVEFVRFPGESHELTRSGSPRHRVQRFELLLDFFAKHLKP